MISQAKTVAAFLRTVPAAERPVYAKLRALFLRYAPGTEVMTSGMPGYANGDVLIGGFNQQKHYLSLYINPEALDPFRPELKKLGLDFGKCCLRFRQPADLPLDLAEKLIRAAAKLAKKSATG